MPVTIGTLPIEIVIKVLRHVVHGQQWKSAIVPSSCTCLELEALLLLQDNDSSTHVCDDLRRVSPRMEHIHVDLDPVCDAMLGTWDADQCFHPISLPQARSVHINCAGNGRDGTRQCIEGHQQVQPMTAAQSMVGALQQVMELTETSSADFSILGHSPSGGNENEALCETLLRCHIRKEAHVRGACGFTGKMRKGQRTRIPLMDQTEHSLSKNGISLKQLAAWNPSVKDDCSGLWSNVWVCVSIVGHDSKGSTTFTPTTTTTTKASPTNGVETPSPTQPEMVKNCNYGLWASVWVCVSVLGHTPSPTKPTPTNGIETPSLIQGGMVKNYNKFHLVQTTTTCSSIENYYKLPLAKFLEWNPDVAKNCQFLLAQYWVCIMTDDYKPAPSPTSPSNGIQTPSPIQENFHKNCNKFHQVQKTTTCSSINNYYNLPLKDFYSWNPSVGTNCQSLLAGYWVCVSIIGWTPPKPSPTTPSNGITTPSPIQAGMVTNCNKFHEVQKTTTCASIQNYYKISMEQLAKWNPKVGSSCNALLVGYHVYVGVVGQTPTQPPKQDPTPTPFLPDMIKNCKKFHLVKATTTCDSIQNYYKITLAQIVKWNPKVGAKCTGLWKDYWVCVSA
ncbi:hypothetical protein FLONG3_7165 [Fusarium longipes]|uniref:LysM domain-containing protein n=1 Tax=Fusarium longipes TaxID=694270 RepID=A0A395SG86_9HYPO|nr:hypothetical protein FLONG3_7165 [Fusarium longipes]